MCYKSLLYAFIGGAVVGAGAALLFAPKKGEELREQIKSMCKKHGLCKNKAEVEVDRLVDEIIASVSVAEK